jgi:hypothetical protein
MNTIGADRVLVDGIENPRGDIEAESAASEPSHILLSTVIIIRAIPVPWAESALPGEGQRRLDFEIDAVCFESTQGLVDPRSWHTLGEQLGANRPRAVASTVQGARFFEGVAPIIEVADPHQPRDLRIDEFLPGFRVDIVMASGSVDPLIEQPP